jgi:hypothetical protein
VQEVKSIVVPLFAVALTATMALPSAASNLVFARHLTLSSNGPSSGAYWISLPYLYTPVDFNSNSIVDAEDLVQDLQPATLSRPCSAATSSCVVAEVWSWDASTGEYVSWTGGSSSGTPFELQPGMAVGIRVQPVGGQTEHEVLLVGANDPQLEHSDCYQAGEVNMRWIALPPNLAIDVSAGVPDVLDAEDLGRALGGPEHVYQVRRLDESTGAWQSWVVGSVFGTPFEVSRSRGYAVDLSCADIASPCAGCQWDWTPQVN